MKFKLEITINKPRTEVWEVFTTPEKMKQWQPSLVNIELVGGDSCQTGAVTKLTYEEGGRGFSLIEKITLRNEMNQFDVVYENEFTDNPVSNQFTEQGEGETLWTVESGYKFKTFVMKLLGPFLKRNFVRRTQKDMERFKEFVENL